MNKTKLRDTDETCNICGSTIELHNGATLCGNLDCPTRNRKMTLRTDMTDEEVREYIDSKPPTFAKVVENEILRAGGEL